MLPVKWLQRRTDCLSIFGDRKTWNRCREAFLQLQAAYISRELVGLEALLWEREQASRYAEVILDEAERPT